MSIESNDFISDFFTEYVNVGVEDSPLPVPKKVNNDGSDLKIPSEIANLVKYAKKYFDNNWAIVPCRITKKDDKKTPLFYDSWAKTYAKTLPEFVSLCCKYEERYRKYPTCIAILTGEVSNLFVLDLDQPVKESISFIRNLGVTLNPMGYKVQTQSKAFQLYFTFDRRLTDLKTTRSKLKDPSTGNPLPVDIRGTGGIVFAPPSYVLDYNKNTRSYYKIILKNCQDPNSEPGVLEPPPKELIDYLLSLNNLEKNNSGSIASNEESYKEWGQLSDEKQKILEEHLVKTESKPASGSRSEVDYAFICRAIGYGVHPDVIFNNLAERSIKCAELKKKSESVLLNYLKHSYQNALKSVTVEYSKQSKIIESKVNVREEVSFFDNTLRLQFYQFWDIIRDKKTSDIVKCSINRHKLYTFFDKNNIFHFNSSLEEIAVATDRIITYLTYDKLKNLLLVYIDTLYKKEYIQRDVCEKLVNEICSIKIKIDSVFIPARNIKLLKDTEFSTYFCFKTYVVKATKSGPICIQYRDLENDIYINSSDIIDYDFNYDAEMIKNSRCKSMMEQFVNCITAGNRVITLNEEIPQKRKHRYESVIGYLISTYKSSSQSPAIVLSDELMKNDTPENATGGRGKSATIKAVGTVRKVVTVAGRVFDRGDKFSFQRVDRNTRIINIDDIPKNFDFETMFSDIYEGFGVQEKYKKEEFLGFKDAPKFVITTNFSISAKSVSAKRRIYECELKPFFNLEHNINKEFGVDFFTTETPESKGWSKEEWDNFYSYMILCSCRYLLLGLDKERIDSIEYKRFVNGTSIDFVEFITERISLNTYYSVNDIREDLIGTCEDFDSRRFSLDIRTTRMWLRQYADYKKYHILFLKKRMKGMSNPVSCFIISQNPITIINDCFNEEKSNE